MEPPKDKTLKEEPPKGEPDPNVLRVRVFKALLHKQPDWLSEQAKTVLRNQEIIVLVQRGAWFEVVVRKTGEVGWIEQRFVRERNLELSEKLSGKAGP